MAGVNKTVKAVVAAAAPAAVASHVAVVAGVAAAAEAVVVGAAVVAAVAAAGSQRSSVHTDSKVSNPTTDRSTLRSVGGTHRPLGMSIRRRVGY
jgi:ABC-type hemin transport system substrate-binding protein